MLLALQGEKESRQDFEESLLLLNPNNEAKNGLNWIALHLHFEFHQKIHVESRSCFIPHFASHNHEVSLCVRTIFGKHTRQLIV